MNNIKSERIQFRNFTKNDLKLIKSLYQSKAVMQNITNGIVFSDKRCQQQLELFLAHQLTDSKLGQWVAECKFTNKPIGIFLIKEFPNISEPGIGYSLLPEFWGMGFATEGSKELIKYFKGLNNNSKLCAITSLDHNASINVLEKIGFKFIKNISYDSPLDGTTNKVSYFLKQF